MTAAPPRRPRLHAGENRRPALPVAPAFRWARFAGGRHSPAGGNRSPLFPEAPACAGATANGHLPTGGTLLRLLGAASDFSAAGLRCGARA